jgi:hypothetical protein
MYEMASVSSSRKRRIGWSLAAWTSVATGLYGLFAVATILGFAAGAFAGLIGLMLSLAVLTDRPGARTTRVAKTGLALNALALAGVLAILLVWALEL